MRSVGQRIKDHGGISPPWGRFQLEGIRFIERHNGRCIVGDEMGLGKSYQALAYMALHPEVRPAVVVCPASLKYNWQREGRKHTGIEIQVLDAHKEHGVQVRLWPETRNLGEPKTSTRWFNSVQARKGWLGDHWHRVEVIGLLHNPHPPLSDVVVVNYDILSDWRARLLELNAKLYVLDEVHRIKDRATQRHGNVQVLARNVEQIVGMSGTPILSRPVEFFPILQLIAPQDFESFHDYAFSYCSPRIGMKGKWEYRGASALPALHARVMPYMIRRTKAEVAKELPPKVRTVIPVKLANEKEYHRAELEFINWYAEAKGQAAAERARRGATTLVKFGELKRLAAKGRLAACVEWVREWLEDNPEQKIVIFAVHREMVNTLHKAFAGSVLIHGGTPLAERQAAVDRFQGDPRCRQLVGNIQAAGEGITLTAASTVVFFELGWTPAEHEQAADRVLRIGQTAKVVNVYYFVGHGTVEERVMNMLEKKAGVVGQILDGEARTVPTKIIEDLLLGAGNGCN